MPWFKVDDGFCVHPKTIGLDMSARGLWVTAGSWCAQQLTDGVITDKQVRMLGGTRRQAEKLVTAGLWSADDAPPSERRYAFNDWLDFQPTREETQRRRQEDADRKRKAREAKGVKQAERENVRPDNPVDVRPESALPGIRPPSALPDPTRPDPTIKREGEVVNVREVGAAASTPPSPENSPEWATANADGHPAQGVDSDNPSDWCTPEDPRCRDHAHIPPGGDVPKCRACANVRQWFHAQEQAELDAARTEIDQCEFCDERGLTTTLTADGDPVALRCDHRTPPPPVVESPKKPRPTVHVPNWRQAINTA